MLVSIDEYVITNSSKFCQDIAQTLQRRHEPETGRSYLAPCIPFRRLGAFSHSDLDDGEWRLVCGGQVHGPRDTIRAQGLLSV